MSALTTNELDDLIDTLTEEMKLPRLERSVGLDYDEITYILEAIEYYKEPIIG